MQKREKIIIALVIVAIIYGALDFTLSSRKKQADASRPTQTASKAALDLTAKLQALSSPDDRKIDGLAASLTEPWPEQIFVPGQITFDTEEKKVDEKAAADLNILRAKVEQLVYSGFVATDSDRIAIINDMDYRVGEQINGFTITKITKESVEVSQQEATFDIPATTEQAPALSEKKAPAPENDSPKALP